MSGYVFGTTDLVDEQRESMQRCLDPITFARLEDLGVGPGWRCLDVGGGGGSVADRLGRMVGETGSVLVTDTAPDGLCTRGNVEVRHHDIVTDELPEAEFDLVHARLVLLHLPERRRALDRMVRALKPGGWLLLGEFDCTWLRVLAAPSAQDGAAFSRFHRALCAVLEQAGADVEWGVHAYRAVQELGLVEIGSLAHAEPWPGGGDGARWLEINSRQLEERLLGTGPVTAGDLDGVRASLGDPAFVVSSYLTISTWGRRPVDGWQGRAGR
ncbi:class I SAM-dependent methyltransferase [Pseudonocardia sp. KRD291]|uniref:class I SAM-dependent methyltransferase n=1 Tax=Pseudonocardia sp. KRD291 TaxID=2792007 RepID=UPI001C49CA34|nr:class I SAM-dependent methyltransferase [Pseudonocardia sp. KRD291]MBW0101757.1 class I SAM-dependent methyltransferase [Pseudonocardia sp. KRD291]